MGVFHQPEEGSPIPAQHNGNFPESVFNAYFSHDTQLKGIPDVGIRTGTHIPVECFSSQRALIAGKHRS